jgi:transposase
MCAYSTDLKERLVRAVANGQLLREAARRFGVAVTTVKRAVVQKRATASLARKPIPGRPGAIRREHEAILRSRLEAAPDATVLEHYWAGWRGAPDMARLVPLACDVSPAVTRCRRRSIRGNFGVDSGTSASPWQLIVSGRLCCRVTDFIVQ